MTERQMNSVKQFIDYAQRTKQAIIEYVQTKGVTIDSLIEVIKMAFEENGASYDRLAVERVIKLIQQKEQILSDFDEVIRMLIEWKGNSNTAKPIAKLEEGDYNNMVTSTPAEKVSEVSQENLEAQVTFIMKDLGIPAHIKGYYYLRYAIVYLAVKEIRTISITKELYPAVAKEFNTDSSRAERAMRHAIEIAWERGNPEALENYFGYTVDPQKGKPTNGEFVYMIADYLKQH